MFLLILFFHRLRDHIELHVLSRDRYYLNSSDYCEGHTENSLRLKSHLHWQVCLDRFSLAVWMEKGDGFFHDKYTCSKTSVVVFEQGHLSRKNL